MVDGLAAPHSCRHAAIDVSCNLKYLFKLQNLRLPIPDRLSHPVFKETVHYLVAIKESKVSGFLFKVI